MKRIKWKTEQNRTIRMIELIALCVFLLGSAVSFIRGFAAVNADFGKTEYTGTLEMTRNPDEEDFEDLSVCEVRYTNDDSYMIVPYTAEEYEQLESTTITAYEYETENGVKLYLDHPDATEQEIAAAYQTVTADSTMSVFNLGSSLAILSLSVALVFLFSGYFTAYEKIWFLSIMVLATIFSVIFPEESANGVNGIVIMLLYLLDTFLNILCELLISKQSKYNFLVSILVEITEIVICIVLMYRFATLAVTLFFWLPIDILSYINWSKHQDEEEEELTAVRRLKGYQEVLVILAIILWTAGVGYLISGLDIATDFYNNETLETAIIYIDACASAVGIANGLFIFFRLREQWIAWYICALLEGVINVLSGQYVLLILKLGYLTNTTYGYIKWTKYIKSRKEEKLSLF